MATKRVIKKDMLYRTIGLFVFIIALIIIGKVIGYYTSDVYKLTKGTLNK